MKYFLIILLLTHGAIHLIGFVKYINPESVTQITHSISKGAAVVWLATAALFFLTAIGFYLNTQWWSLTAITAVAISSILIVSVWSDARFGTIANIIILIAAIIGLGTWKFKNRYTSDVESAFTTVNETPDAILSEETISALPEPVQKYIRYTGALEKPAVESFKITMAGKIRSAEDTPWMEFTTEQYNFMDRTWRLFFMEAKMKGLPVAGYHAFKNGTAYMDIRLLSLIKVEYHDGEQMDVAETVTFFNDMCCMAPGSLTDNRIEWLETEGNVVRAAFTNNGIRISAWLHFNEEGQLVNFVSEDRWALEKNGKMSQVRWETPLYDYREINGYRLASRADLIYNYPEGDFCYGKFEINNIDYSVKLPE
jgi:hypothetical protein